MPTTFIPSIHQLSESLLFCEFSYSSWPGGHCVLCLSLSLSLRKSVRRAVLHHYRLENINKKGGKGRGGRVDGDGSDGMAMGLGMGVGIGRHWVLAGTNNPHSLGD